MRWWIVFVAVCFIPFVSADTLSLQGTVVDENSTLVNGNISFLLYDAASGGSLLYNSSSEFDGELIDGRYDIQLGLGASLSLVQGKTYYLDMLVNQEDQDFDGNERYMFVSPVGVSTSDAGNVLYVSANYTNVSYPYFETLTSAKTAASAGDLIYVYPGVYDEKNLLKDEVNYYFSPGAIVEYTGTATGAIFDDYAHGTNAAVTTTIAGYGTFIYAGSVAASGTAIMNLGYPDTFIDFHAQKIILNASTATYTVFLLGNGNVRATVSSVESYDAANGDDAYVIATTNESGATALFADIDIYEVFMDGGILFSTGTGTSSSQRVDLEVNNFTVQNQNTYSPITSQGGVSVVSIPVISSAYPVNYAAGELHIKDATLESTTTGGFAAPVFVSNNDGLTLENVELISGTGASESIYELAGTPRVTILGQVVASHRVRDAVELVGGEYIVGSVSVLSSLYESSILYSYVSPDRSVYAYSYNSSSQELSIPSNTTFSSLLTLTPTSSVSACSSSLAGSVYMDNSSGITPCYCNGTAWVRFENNSASC